jgi:hypothetical protein
MASVWVPQVNSVPICRWWRRGRINSRTMFRSYVSMITMPALMIDSVDRIRHRQRSQVESLAPIKLEEGIGIHHNSTVDLHIVS